MMIITYKGMCEKIGKGVQSGMHYMQEKDYSAILTSERHDAKYKDYLISSILIYQGHDLRGDKEKKCDQPMYNKSGIPSENGKFYEAAKNYKEKKSIPRKVLVFKKRRIDMWEDLGVFELTDVKYEHDKQEKRRVFTFIFEKSPVNK